MLKLYSMTHLRKHIFLSRKIGWVIATIILGLGYTVGLVLDWPSWLHGSNWVWIRRVPELLWWRGLLLLGILFVGILLFHIAKREGPWQRWQTALFLTILIFFTFGIQLAIAAQHRSQPLAVAFWSAPGFFLEGVHITDASDFLQNHLTSMPHYRDVHVQTQPPGWILTFWATRKVLERIPDLSEPLGHWFRRYDCLAFDLQGLTPPQIAATILPISLLLISGLGVLPLYGLGQRMFSKKVTRLAVIVYPFLPAFLVFQGRFDTLYAVISLTALWLTTEIMFRSRWWLVAALGLLLGGITFWGFGAEAIILLVNLFLLIYLSLLVLNHSNKPQPSSFFLHPFLTVNAAIGLVVLLLWGSLWLKWGINGISMFQLSQALHQKMRLNYPIWALFNLYDLAVFMGIPVAVGSVIGLKTSLHLIFKRTPINTQLPIHQTAFILSWGLAVFILNVSGQVRAETGRLWLFLFTPGLLIGVAGWDNYLVANQRYPKYKRENVWGYLIFAAYMIQALAAGYFLGGRIPPSTVPEPMWRMPKSAVALDYQLGESISLNGYEMQIIANELHLTLYWQALQRPPEDYSAFVHLIGSDGNILAQTDGVPQQGGLPTWCWVPGEIVTDKRVLSLVDERGIPITDAVIGVGLYDWRTGIRLPVTTASTDNNMIRLPLSDR